MPPVRRTTEPSIDPPDPLTSREMEVARWLGRDASYQEIADTLQISPETVRAHAKSICRKLGVRSRHAAVHQLWERKLITRRGNRHE